jgi:hypothetical protein
VLESFNLNVFRCSDVRFDGGIAKEIWIFQGYSIANLLVLKF